MSKASACTLQVRHDSRGVVVVVIVSASAAQYEGLYVGLPHLVHMHLFWSFSSQERLSLSCLFCFVLFLFFFKKRSALGYFAPRLRVLRLKAQFSRCPPIIPRSKSSIYGNLEEVSGEGHAVVPLQTQR